MKVTRARVRVDSLHGAIMRMNHLMFHKNSSTNWSTCVDHNVVGRLHLPSTSTLPYPTDPLAGRQTYTEQGGLIVADNMQFIKSHCVRARARACALFCFYMRRQLRVFSLLTKVPFFLGHSVVGFAVNNPHLGLSEDLSLGGRKFINFIFLRKCKENTRRFVFVYIWQFVTETN